MIENRQLNQNELFFTASHEWVKLEGNNLAVVGITEHAQSLLGELVFLELPEADIEVSQGDEFAVVESVKAAADVYAPVSGRVVEINERLSEEPSLVNSDCYGEGWLCKIKLSDPEELQDLLDAEHYAAELES